MAPNTNAPGFPAAEQLAALLNRCAERGIAVWPYTGLDGTIYTVEWYENGRAESFVVQRDGANQRWVIADGGKGSK